MFITGSLLMWLVHWFSEYVPTTVSAAVTEDVWLNCFLNFYHCLLLQLVTLFGDLVLRDTEMKCVVVAWNNHWLLLSWLFWFLRLALDLLG